MGALIGKSRMQWLVVCNHKRGGFSIGRGDNFEVPVNFRYNAKYYSLFFFFLYLSLVRALTVICCCRWIRELPSAVHVVL